MAMETSRPEKIGIEGEIPGKFSVGLYIGTLVRILGSPKRFFEGLPHGDSMAPAMGCLLASTLFYACAGLTQPHERPLVTALILCS
jgi:hypothetical protein